MTGLQSPAAVAGTARTALRVAWWVSALFPLCLTLVYFQALAGSARWLQQAVYVPGKLLQFSMPVLWAAWREHWRPRWRRPAAGEIGTGLLSGAVIAAAGWGVYAGGLLPPALIDSLRAGVGERVAALGLDSPLPFILLGIGYSTVHAGLEEYYWRWFVYGRARLLFAPTTAVLAASTAFTLHHVVVLGTFLGYASAWTWLLSLGVACGGVLWCLMMRRHGQLWGAWLSHALVDAAIFAIGHDLLFG